VLLTVIGTAPAAVAHTTTVAPGARRSPFPDSTSLSATPRMQFTPPPRTTPAGLAPSPRPTERLVQPLLPSAYEVGEISVGYGATGTGYDPRDGALLVAENDPNRVVAVDPSTNTVVKAVSVDPFPSGVVYDPDTNAVVVVSDDQDDDYHGVSPANATILNASSLTIVGNVSLSGGARFGAFDPRNGFVYVPLHSNGTVRVINTTTARAVANITLAEPDPMGIAFDSEDGNFYVTDYLQDNVTRIGGANATPLGSFAVGEDPYDIAFDNRSGALFVSDNYGDGVSEIDASTGKVTRTSWVGQYPLGVAYDAVDNLVYVANFLSANISVVNGSTGALVGSIPVGGSPQGITYDPVNHLLYVTELGENYLDVVGRPLAVGLGASTADADVGAPVRLAASVTNGIAPYVSYTWSFGDGNGSTGRSANVAHAYTQPGTYSVVLTVTDSQGFEATAQMNATIEPVPTVGAPTAYPPSADVGQSVTFTTSPSLGVAPYTDFHWKGLPIGCSGSTATVVCSDLVTPEENLVSVSVTDSGGRTSAQSGPLSFVVLPDPSTTVPVGNRSSLDVGQSVQFSAAFVDVGSGSDRYQWQSDPQVLACTPSTEFVFDCLAKAPGSIPVNLTATDSNGGASTATLANFTVFPDPSVRAARIGPSEIDLGASSSINVSTDGGSGRFNYAWHGLPAGCVAFQANFTCQPIAAGWTNVSVTVTDSNGVSATSFRSTLRVNPAVSGSLPGAPTKALAGETLTFTAQPAGGSAPYRFAWAFGDGTAGSGAQVRHTYAEAGEYAIELWINDTLNGTFEENWVVAISAPPPPSSTVGPLGPSTVALVAGLGAAIVLAVAAGSLLIRRRRARRAPRALGEVAGRTAPARPHP
jgi:YVTN family beta-propeller protein